MKNIKIPIDSTGLGDVLLFTAVCKHIPEATIVLKDSNKKFKFLFKNICKEVIIDNNLRQLPDIGSDHYTKQKLRYFGIETDDILPKIILEENKLIEYKKIISKYNNPIVFVSNCSKQWSYYRQFPDSNSLQKMIDKLSKEFTILHFALSDNYTKYANVTPMLDIDLEELPYYYASVGRYLGVDTGDYHLMLACGGNSTVFVPDSNIFYS